MVLLACEGIDFVLSVVHAVCNILPCCVMRAVFLLGE